MTARCHNRKFHRYKDYGGKGIKVCKIWRDNPAKFVKWASKNGYKEGVHLHRINKSKGYTPTNCEFKDRLQHIKEHNAKLSVNDSIHIKSKRDKLIKKLSKKYNVHANTIMDIFMNRSWK